LHARAHTPNACTRPCPQIRRVLPYLKASEGGLTCSGGEPLLQPQFTATLFREAHAMGLTTTLDTTGQGTKHKNWDVVLPHTDSVLFCIKSLDPDWCAGTHGADSGRQRAVQRASDGSGTSDGEADLPPRPRD
jgi:pyruvate-formate lyase-activating enzyme